jgi:uncharacterized protein YegJ (DUF2314 family)
MNFRKKRNFILALLFLAALGCRKEYDDKVIQVAADDPQMNAAIATARETVGTFTAALRKPRPGQRSFSVKMRVEDRKHVEHMWLDEVTFDGTRFHGVINNEPDLVKNVKTGDPASVEASQISDWMFVDNGKLVGGYSVRLLRERMSPKERAEFDRSAGFKIE